MRQAFMLLGIMTLVVSVGAFIAFSRKVEAPHDTDNKASMSLSLTSPAFGQEGTIPSKYTCDGDNINPELNIANVPQGTKSFVLVMDDPDIPEEVKKTRGIEVFDHWVVYNIPESTTMIPEGKDVGSFGLNSRGTTKYAGPCPPDREHRYFFRLYALRDTLNFINVPTLKEVEDAAQSLMIEKTELMGRYERINK
jgi:Raf kinase inhibitor-like YbhB/YbcL family protein